MTITEVVGHSFTRYARHPRTKERIGFQFTITEKNGKFGVKFGFPVNTEFASYPAPKAALDAVDDLIADYFRKSTRAKSHPPIMRRRA